MTTQIDDVPKPQVAETMEDIATSISQTLDEHLADIAYELTRIADRLELVTGKLDRREYDDDKGFVRVVNIE